MYGLRPLMMAVPMGNEDPLVAPYVAAMTSAPTPGQRTAIDKLCKTLRTAGLVGKLDRLYLLHSHHEQASRINLLNPAETLLAPINAPTFTAYSGWQGDGSTQELRMPSVYSFAGAKFGLTDAHIGWGCGSTSGSGVRNQVGNTGGSLNYAQIQMGSNTGNLRQNSGVNTPVSATLHGGSRLGQFIMSRHANHYTTLDYNGSRIVDNNDGVTNEIFSTNAGCVMRNAGAYSADGFWWYGSGGALTEAEAAADAAAMETYRTEYVA